MSIFPSVSYSALLLLVLCSGCSTITEGRSQQIAIDTMPEGANCILKSNDDVIGIVSSTPGLVHVEKSKYDIVIECTKDGYIKSKIKNHSDFAMSGVGNMILGHWGFVGSMVDSATGASNKYNSRMLITLDADKEAKPVQTAFQHPMQTPMPAQPAPSPAVQALLAPSIPLPAPTPVPPAPATPPVLDVTKWSTPEAIMEQSRRTAAEPGMEVADISSR